MCSHREPNAHGCTTVQVEERTVRNEAGRALLAKIFPQTAQSAAASSSPTGSSTTTSATAASVPANRKAPTAAAQTNPKKAAQLRQVAFMKMRHKAQPGDPKSKSKSVAMDEKLFVRVQAEEKGGEEKVFWFQKVMRALPFPDTLSAC